MIGKSKLRTYAICLLAIQSFQIVFPNAALALTSGPSQPEMQQFTPIGTSDMVDLFTGDFNYNIPLMDVEGYPINLAYASGITSDQESSWVGLGWNINPGMINRNLRGIPDDFDGDEVIQKQSLKKDWTVGFKLGMNAELTGWDLFDEKGFLSTDFFFNSYKLLGHSTGISLLAASSGSLNGSLNVSSGNQSGLSISASFGLDKKGKENYDSYVDVSAGINSRQGLQSVSFGTDMLMKSYKDASKKGKVGFQNGDVGFSFSKPVFFPSADMPKKNFSLTLTAKVGGELLTFFPDGMVSGYYYEESLQDNQLNLHSYGSLHSDHGKTDDEGLLDFAREKDIPVRENSVNIAIPYGTFDVFNVSGHDISGSYHPVRNDLGMFHDRYTKTGGATIDAGVDLGIGAFAHVGFEISGVFPKRTTSMWTESNDFDDVSNFTSLTGNNLYEPVYFKNAGEMPIDKGAMFEILGGAKKTRVDIARSGTNSIAMNTLLSQSLYTGTSSSSIVTSNIQNTDRMIRHQVFSFLTADEASKYGLDKKILSYPYNESAYQSCVEFEPDIDSLERTSYENHHISEITVTQPDGKRYIYGIPAYNKVQIEATFSVEGEVDEETNLVTYDDGIDNTIENDKGKDHYFESKEIPPYAHSYLLTAVLSPDYVDNTGNGVTADDKGQAYKLNYTKMPYAFKWRTPLEENSATFQEGFKSKDNDDKGSYVYGEKEVWYLHSIESRNMVARFTLSDRLDGFGVSGENGGVSDANKLQKVDRIDLYAKSDLIKYGEVAIPIKSVHFVYDYSLCKGIPNSADADTGKLTLQAIYFTYGNNTKGIINQYKFNYDESNPDYNPEYSALNYDRWGMYKEHDSYPGYFPGEAPTTLDFPYTIQDKTAADQFSSVWCLRQIDLPSGGTINVTYESDDYAYVQDRRAAQMMSIEGFGTDTTTIESDGKIYELLENREFMFIHLPKYVYSVDEFRDLYLEGLEHLYYKFYIDVTGDEESEYVEGYCNWVNSGVKYLASPGDSSNVAWLELEMVEDDVLGEASPIAVNAWQFLRLNLPEKAYPGSDLSTGDPEDVLWAVISILPSLGDLILGFNNMARIDGKGKFVDLDKAWVRLDNPTYQKFGGGSRVKTITISDNWEEMVSTQDSYEYGQNYSYTTIDPVTQKIISSGVASYEPAIGNEENPFRTPVFFEETAMIAPDNSYYAELPLGEALFPSPSVGYSKVTVKNLDHEGVTRTATGYSISEFFTAKDFPYLAAATDLEPIRVKPNPVLKFLNILVKDYLTCSQGFYVEVNDMHGKPKKESVYDATGFLISSKQYDYKVDDPIADTKHLKNECEVIYPDGTVGIETIGLDFEAWEDMRQQETKINGGGLKGNADFTTPIPFIPIIGIYPSIVNTHTRFRSTATTKFVKRFGILDKITVTDKGSTITTQNLLYDSETGQVLLSKVTNEFEDPIYKFNYPAHWIYKTMGPSYENIGGTFTNVTINNGEIDLTDPELYFKPGDEVAILYDAMPFPVKLHVIWPTDHPLFVDMEGKLYTALDPAGASLQPVTAKIIRSGNRNMSSFSAGSITSLENPINDVSDELDISDATNIINAEAIVYKEQWKQECKDFITVCDYDSVANDQCLTGLIYGLFHTEEFEFPELFYTNESDGVVGEDFANLGGCDYLNKSFYFLSDLGPNNVYDDLDPTIAAISVPSICDFDAAVGGDCNVRFLNTYGSCLPLLESYNITQDDALPTWGVTTRMDYIGPDALWLGDTLFEGTTVGYFYLSCISNCEEVCVDFVEGDTVNPYHTNMLGAWRPFKTFAYHNLRTPSTATGSTNLRVDGTFDDFDEFYSYNSGEGAWDIDSVDENWIWTTESLLFDKHGNEIQSKNALNIYSAALYGYNKSLVKAVANNASINQIANENFEDFDFKKSCNDLFCAKKHWSYEDSLDYPDVFVSDEISHTGLNSLKLTAGSEVENEKDITTFEGNELDLDESDDFYILGENPCISDFSPQTGNYVFSAWVRVDSTCHCTNYEGDFIEISFEGSATEHNLSPAGPVIEGWQRIEAKFEVPSSATSIKVKLIADAEHDTYFDDIRIHPFLGNMKAFVYDRKSMRLMAELDENNFATFYEYDDEGILLRVKRETERGIMTIQEGRSKLKSNL